MYIHSDILSDILSGIYSDILSGILSGIYSDIPSDISDMGTAGPQPRAPDLSGHCHAEAWQCPLKSGACS